MNRPQFTLTSLLVLTAIFAVIFALQHDAAERRAQEERQSMARRHRSASEFDNLLKLDSELESAKKDRDSIKSADPLADRDWLKADAEVKEVVKRRDEELKRLWP